MTKKILNKERIDYGDIVKVFDVRNNKLICQRTAIQGFKESGGHTNKSMAYIKDITRFMITGPLINYKINFSRKTGKQVGNNNKRYYVIAMKWSKDEDNN